MTALGYGVLLETDNSLAPTLHRHPILLKHYIPLVRILEYASVSSEIVPKQ